MQKINIQRSLVFAAQKFALGRGIEVDRADAEQYQLAKAILRSSEDKRLREASQKVVACFDSWMRTGQREVTFSLMILGPDFDVVEDVDESKLDRQDRIILHWPDVLDQEENARRFDRYLHERPGVGMILRDDEK